MKSKSVQQQIVDMFANVNLELSQSVLLGTVGAKEPEKGGSEVTKKSPALSQMNTSFSPDTRKVGVIVDDGFNGEELIHVLNELKKKVFNLS